MVVPRLVELVELWQYPVGSATAGGTAGTTIVPRVPALWRFSKALGFRDDDWQPRVFK